MWHVLSKLTTGPKARAVILTSHALEEVSALSKRIGIMSGGRLRLQYCCALLCWHATSQHLARSTRCYAITQGSGECFAKLFGSASAA
eukprot:13516-Heterococcus_DN1.PRE.6